MGKNLIQQARGKGGPRYKSPSFRFRGASKHRPITKESFVSGTVLDLVNCPGHSAPLMLIGYDDGEICLTVAPEGVRVGQDIGYGDNVEVSAGNSTQLKNLPEGTLVFNIESKPGDGGKFCRAGGSAGKIASKLGDKVTIILPSKKKKDFNGDCRANIGIVAGGGRLEKPLMKAGNRHHKMKAKNKYYPLVSGAKQNAVDHPFGNSRSSRKSKAKPVSRLAPPGRKVGMIAARRSGRLKK